MATSKECANCTASEGVTLSSCSRCKLVYYCSKACQTQHWQGGGHKKFCIPVGDRRPDAGKASCSTIQVDACAICLELMLSVESLTLACLHVFHEACPTCRGPLRTAKEETMQTEFIAACVKENLMVVQDIILKDKDIL
jgi:hypothetical protein